MMKKWLLLFLVLLTFGGTLNVSAYTNETTTTKEFEKLTKYHEFNVGSHFILGANTHIYNKERTVRNEKYKIFNGYTTDEKTGEQIPTYLEGVRNGDVYNINSTTKLAQGTAFKLVDEVEFYIGTDITKTTFWKIEHVVSKQTYYIQKVGTWVQNVTQHDAMRAGYRLHFTFYDYNVYATTHAEAYKTAVLTSQGETVTFDKKNLTSVNKYTHFTYRGLYYANNEWWVYVERVADKQVFYVKATNLKGGIPPYEEEKPSTPITPTTKPDTSDKDNNTSTVTPTPTPNRVKKEPIYGMQIQPFANFATVYNSKGRTGLQSPTKLFLDRLYTYNYKSSVAGRDYIELRSVETNKLTYYVYVDEIYEDTYEQVLTGVDYTATKLAYGGELETAKTRSYIYRSLSGTRLGNRLTVGLGEKFVVTDIVDLQSAGVVVKGNVTTGGKTYNNVYVRPVHLIRKPTEAVYDKNIKVLTNKVEIMERVLGYTNVQLVGNQAQTSGASISITDGSYYTIVSSKVVGDKVYTKIKPYNSASEYFVDLERVKIKFHYN